MPDLLHSLRGYDLAHLHIIAGLWGMELPSQDADEAARQLSAAMLDPALGKEMLTALEPQAQLAFRALARAGGRMPWAAFARAHGDVREMGAGRRDRERPYLKPASAAESLFYHGLVARAFFDTDKGPQEFAYLPEDLLSVMMSAASAETAAPAQPLGHPASPTERLFVLPADDRILDDTTTLLAAVRSGHKLAADPVLEALLGEARLLKRGGLQAQAVKAFLEAPRAQALSVLVDAWRAGQKFNELRLVPGLLCEGEWVNPPRPVREFVLQQMQAIPVDTWWSLTAFVADVKSKYPDFERPAGDYDSWFIKSAADGRFLRGFADWDQVDGALIRFMIGSVMHRLGMLDVGCPGENREPAAFRIRATRTAPTATPEEAKLQVASQGTITVPRRAARAVRYQLARFCEWGEERSDEYRYRVTPRSLGRAAGQGLKVEHLLVLLARNSEAGIPPVLIKALKRWETHGTEARAETQAVLRVKRPEILEQLRKSRAARFLGEPLGPTAVVIKAGAQARVMTALAEMGFLAEDTITDPEAADRPVPTEKKS